MCDDGLTGDPCIDFGIECGDPNLTGDPCIDYGYCDPAPMPQPEAIQKDQLTNNCFKGVLAKYILGPYGTAGSVSALGNILNLSFGLSNTWTMVFTDATTVLVGGVAAEASAELEPHPSNPTHGIITITLSRTELANASQEYIAAAILHEIQHAYLTKQYPNSVQMQHESMAGDFLRNQVVTGITDAFYNATDTQWERDNKLKEAQDLAWGGLNEDANGNPITQNWVNLKADAPNVASRIQAKNSSHKAGTDGTDCP